MPQDSNNRRQKLLLILCILLVILCAVVTAAVVLLGSRTPVPPGTTPPASTPAATTEPTTAPTVSTAEPTTQPTTVPTEPPVEKVASATVISLGDILMHGPVRQTYITRSQFTDGVLLELEHNYDPIFTYIQPYISQADYAVINLETPLAGLGNGYPYSGVIGSFNAPDAILDAAKNAGFDMFLTANNHTYDCGSFGMHRTMEAILERELAYLGTQQATDEPDYAVVDLNGIRVGMSCYTYEVPNAGDASRKSLNGKWVSDGDLSLVSSFDAYWMELFYSQVAADIAGMKADGAETVVLYIHWGDEYQLTENTTQNAIAQRLCDLGADVIVGGHPHVVQPVELLTSTTDPKHKTVCLYSMGNAVSAQRRDKMRLSTGHTEDGVMFSLTFSKYSDGTVILENADIIPTWVNDQYQILPADGSLASPADPDSSAPGTTEPSALEEPGLTVSEAVLALLQESHDRTMAIVGEGLAAARSYLEANTARVEDTLGVKN